MLKSPTNIAIFATGTGSNALSIIEHFAATDDINVALIISNNARAGVLKHAKANNIPAIVVSRQLFKTEAYMLKLLKMHQVDFIALAGFLWLIPGYLVDAYPKRILNIHPALLPKYGGKGMYGMNVHQAVAQSNDLVSGMTIHFVNDKYDEGQIIRQASVELESTDTADIIAAKILTLEHQYYPPTIERVIRDYGA